MILSPAQKQDAPRALSGASFFIRTKNGVRSRFDRKKTPDTVF